MRLIIAGIAAAILGLPGHGAKAELRPNEVGSLIQVAPDVRFVDYLLDGTRFVAIDRMEDDDLETTKQIMDTAVNSVHAVSAVLKTTNRALEDDRVDHRERSRIRARLEDAERELATLRLLIDEV